MALNPYVRGEFKPNVSSCSYSAEINSRNPGDYSGASQQVTFTVPLTSETYMDQWGGASLFLDDSAIIEQGQVTAISDTGTQASYTVAGLASRLNRSRKVQPFNNTALTVVVRAYFAAAGVSIPVPNMVGDFNVTVPAWEGDLYDGLKQLLGAYGCYMWLEGDQVEIRQFALSDTLTELPANLVSKGRSVQGQDTVEWVEMAYYNSAYITNRQVYPYGIEAPTVFSVGAEETVVYEVQLNASLESVDQPVSVNTINLGSIDTFGQYAVVDNAGAPVTSAEWLGQGGKVEVRLKDHRTLEVTIRGMSTAAAERAPFRIAEFGDRADAALYVTGTGVRQERKTVRLHTGSSRAVPDTVQTVDNPFVSTLAQAYTAGQWAACDALLSEQVNFGGGPELFSLGTKYRTNSGAYRVAGVGLSPGGSSFNATLEVTMKNFADTLGSKTMAQMATIWSGKTMGQVAIEPLRTA